ncbi:unnamed protein product [Ectocarpus sp. 12 AP-2014]
MAGATALVEFFGRGNRAFLSLIELCLSLIILSLRGAPLDTCTCDCLFAVSGVACAGIVTTGPGVWRRVTAQDDNTPTMSNRREPQQQPKNKNICSASSNSTSTPPYDTKCGTWTHWASSPSPENRPHVVRRPKTASVEKQRGQVRARRSARAHSGRAKETEAGQRVNGQGGQRAIDYRFAYALSGALSGERQGDKRSFYFPLVLSALLVGPSP